MGQAWSPEQIARRLLIDFPDDKTMRVSHEAIYKALFGQVRGALHRELSPACERGAFAGPQSGEARALSRRRS